MTPGIPPQQSPAPAFDDAWLARAAQTVLHVSDGIAYLQLSDPDTGLRCFARSAPLAQSGPLHDEARLAGRLQADWAAVPAATLRNAERVVVVYGGASTSTLAAMLGDAPVPLARFLELAIGSTRALAGAHAHGLLHGDIRPHNLLVDDRDDDSAHDRADDSAGVRLTGFDHATALDAMPPVVPRPGPASWPYQSPEVARGDQARTSARSDLYSLGVTFYRMLTGTLPFTADSPAAWQHAHLAVEPVPPHVRAPGLAPLLGAIVLRLLAKDPADRYAGAMSLLADLLRCQADWRERGEIAPFRLDAAGATPTLNVSGELFGRARETAQLADALARVRHSGQSELVLLAGAAGTGKSALAAWLSCQAGQHGIRFASGKSDQLQLDIPYAPVAQMIRALTQPLLGEPEAALAPVRERWLRALAGQGRAIAVLVPEAGQVLGRTAPLAEVPAQQAQARAQQAILATFATFAEPGAPLVLCFDDLQWADASTIALLEAFTTQRPRNLLLIAAYRDHGNDVEQRFSWLLHASRAGALPVTRIAVRPLAVWELTELVAAALNEPAPRVEALAQLVHAKTDGNPFFSYQLLRALVDDGVLAYRDERDGWHWDEADAAQHRYTDSVTDLMTRRFARLPEEGTELLRQLACVGIRCEQRLLACVAQLDAAQLDERLRPFVDAGLLVRSEDGYAFQHDRVLEAAYAMIAPRERPAAHARIAAIMIGHWQGELAAHAFEIGNQIERAAGHPLPEPQRVAFVQVLLVAARRARRSAAMAQATRYTDAAFALMQPSWWTTHCALAYAASVLHCECLLAQARLEPASQEIDALLARDLPPVDKAAVHRLKASLQTVRSDYEGAINAALSGLALLDIHLERGPGPARMREAYDAVKQALGGRAIDSLGRLPATEDGRIQTIMGLLSTLISSLFVRDGISFLHVAKMVELTLEHGATAESPYGLSWFGVFIASLYEEYEDGLAYGLAAMDLADRHGYEAERIATLVAVDQVSAWTRPLSYALAHAQRAVTLGRASGDIGMACYACNHIASDLLAMGEHLRLVEEEIGRGLALTRLVQYRDIELILYSQHHFLHRLRSGDEAAPQGEAAHQMSAAQRLARANSLPTRFWIWLYDGMAAVFRQEWDHAVRSLREAQALIWSAPAHINVADCRLYLALALSHATAGAASDDVMTEVTAHRDCFARWAALNPQTFRGKLALVDAELARMRGDPLQALAGYEQAAADAAAAGFVHEAALAHELAGMLCEARGLPTAAAQHWRLALAGYRRWGADHKAMLLEARHPQRDVAGHDHGGADGKLSAQRWELGMKAARALSSEIVMDRLIETLMTHVVVAAGAQYGLLLLMRGEHPMIEASARVLDGKVAVTLGSAVPTEQALPLAVLNSVLRTRQTLALDDAMVDAPSIRTRGAIAGGLRSVLCLPLLRGGGLVGVFYLENSLAPAVFDATRIAELEVLAPQVAISLETARLYEQLIEESNRRVAAEMRLRSASSALARTSHLTVMGGLAASIAHEVNQPLTAIVATVDASLRWLNRPRPEVAEALDGFTDIKQYALRAADIIRALRALARQVPAVLAPLHPDDVLREVLEMARLDIDAHEVRVVARLAVGSAVVEADRVQLQQVVLNLITNALDAMAQTPPAQRELIVTSYREQDNVVVSVQDHGAGIPDDVLGQVFEPFFTTKEDGMGMGLAICRSIIEAHGGTLEVRNRRSGGSEFMFRLPVCEMLPAAKP